MSSSNVLEIARSFSGTISPGQAGLREDCHELLPTLLSRKLSKSVLIDQISRQLVSRNSHGFFHHKFVSPVIDSGRVERRLEERFKVVKTESAAKVLLFIEAIRLE